MAPGLLPKALGAILAVLQRAPEAFQNLSRRPFPPSPSGTQPPSCRIAWGRGGVAGSRRVGHALASAKEEWLLLPSRLPGALSSRCRLPCACLSPANPGLCGTVPLAPPAPLLAQATKEPPRHLEAAGQRPSPQGHWPGARPHLPRHAGFGPGFKDPCEVSLEKEGSSWKGGPSPFAEESTLALCPLAPEGGAGALEGPWSPALLGTGHRGSRPCLWSAPWGGKEGLGCPPREETPARLSWLTADLGPLQQHCRSAGQQGAGHCHSLPPGR